MNNFPKGSFGKYELEFFDQPAPQKADYSLVVVLRDNKILLVDVKGRGWSLPGGKVEPYESSTEAARREVFEEALVWIGDLEEIGHYKMVSEGRMKLTSLFTAIHVSKQPFQESDEVSARQYVDWDELDFVYYEWTDLIEAVFAYIRNL